MDTRRILVIFRHTHWPPLVFLIMEVLYSMVESVTIPQGGVREWSGVIGLRLVSTSVLYNSVFMEIFAIS
jgi:hypothetical protein